MLSLVGVIENLVEPVQSAPREAQVSYVLWVERHLPDSLKVSWHLQATFAFGEVTFVVRLKPKRKSD
jgi:hypothetical protein